LYYNIMLVRIMVHVPTNMYVIIVLVLKCLTHVFSFFTYNYVKHNDYLIRYVITYDVESLILRKM